MDPRSRIRVEAPQEAVQRAWLSAREPIAQGVNARRAGDQPVQQCTQVEPGSSHDHGYVAAGGDIGQCGAAKALVVPGGKHLVRIQNVDQMVADPTAVLGRGFCGPDVEVSIQLDRIAVDDLTAEPLSQVQ
jgi:hypothetical protein